MKAEVKLPQTSQASFKKGIWFVFKDDENVIHVWISLKTGKQNVYFNEIIKSGKRILGRQNLTVISDENDNIYDLKYVMTNVKSGCIEYTFSKNHVLKSVQSLTCRHKKAKKGYMILIAVLVGFAMGVMVVILNLPWWLTYVCLIVYLAFRYSSQFNNAQKIEITETLMGG